MGHDGAELRGLSHQAVSRGGARHRGCASLSLNGNIGAGLQTLFGGNITLYTQLCERARQDAFDLMLQHGTEQGANAIISMRYDANEVAADVTEVLAYGTAVVIEADR